MAGDEANWAKPTKTLEPNVIDGALNLNVRGRRLNPASGGFGPLYQKTFTVRVGAAVTPQELIQVWKTRFGTFWPEGQKMFFPETGVAPGEIGVINATLLGTPTMASGVLVIYADDLSFTFMAPEGFAFTGPITFSSFTDDYGFTVAQVQELVRTSDPLWDLMMLTPVLGERMQNGIWRQTLRNLAAHFGIDATIGQRIVCVDGRRQWRNAKNIWYNAAIHSVMSAPLRLLRR
ncbi:MAG: hypothetical protein E6J24_02915 [Chloroflexi bacterium]|nr:MAG: hypothetical protein E6J24_02915 [Chloroflexota bacterium]